MSAPARHTGSRRFAHLLAVLIGLGGVSLLSCEERLPPTLSPPEGALTTPPPLAGLDGSSNTPEPAAWAPDQSRALARDRESGQAQLTDASRAEYAVDGAQSDGQLVDHRAPPPPCPAPLARVLEVELGALAEATERWTLEPCELPRWRLRLAAGARWVLTLRLRGVPVTAAAPSRLASYSAHYWARAEGGGPAAQLLQEAPLEPLPGEGAEGEEREATLTLETVHSGLIGLALEGAPRDAPQTLSLSARCLEGCDRVTTEAPIVLIHGYAGVDRYFGVLDYFYRVPGALRALGAQVIVPRLSPFEWSHRRAAELAAQLSAAMAESGAQRLHLIAHSQGGLDARYLISQLGWGDRVRSLTTIATPHEGIPLNLVDYFSQQDFSPAELERFNAENPADPRVAYFSWSARSCGIVELRCLRELDGELVTPFLAATYTLLRPFGPNDGLVPTANMRYGEHLGELAADHFDQIGQIADEDRGPFPHLSFYRAEFERLLAHER